MSEYEKEVGIHKPGSIQRVKLSNFLTYSNVEFSPGPRYQDNMVVAWGSSQDQRFTTTYHTYVGR
jgi:hypothetical protein